MTRTKMRRLINQRYIEGHGCAAPLPCPFDSPEVNVWCGGDFVGGEKFLSGYAPNPPIPCNLWRIGWETPDPTPQPMSANHYPNNLEEILEEGL